MEIVSPSKLRCAMKTFCSLSSDGISVALLWRAGEAALGPLTRIACTWTHTQGLENSFILKVGWARYSPPTDVHLISLTSFILKTVKRLVTRYIRDDSLSKKPISWDQHTYQMRWSMETALKIVLSLVEAQIATDSFGFSYENLHRHPFNNTSLATIEAALKRHKAPVRIESE